MGKKMLVHYVTYHAFLWSSTFGQDQEIYNKMGIRYIRHIEFKQSNLGHMHGNI